MDHDRKPITDLFLTTSPDVAEATRHLFLAIRALDVPLRPKYGKNIPVQGVLDDVLAWPPRLGLIVVRNMLRYMMEAKPETLIGPHPDPKDPAEQVRAIDAFLELAPKELASHPDFSAEEVAQVESMCQAAKGLEYWRKKWFVQEALHILVDWTNVFSDDGYPKEGMADE